MDTKKLRQKILDLAIHGKLVPQDPNDEPASVLLERIRAEKERLIAEGKIKRSKKSATSDTSHYENVPFELPEGWCWTTIGEVSSSILYGVSESAKETGAYKLLRITDIQDNKVNWDSVPHTDFDKEKALNYLLQDGDILFARTGATVGKSYLVSGLTEESIYASYLIRVQTSQLIFPEYIKRFFESGYYWEQITLSSVGIGQPNVNGTTLANLNVPIPPYKEQLRIVEETNRWLAIADILDENTGHVCKAIESAKAKILDLAIHGKLVPQEPNDEPASVLLKRVNPKAVASCDNPHYAEPYELPDGWTWCKLIDICTFLSRGKSPKYSETDTTYPVFAQKCNLKGGGISLEKAQFLEPTTLKRWPDVYHLQTGDVLVNSTGTGTVGRTRLFNESCLGDFPFVVPDSHVSVIRTHGEIVSEYIFALMSSSWIQTYLEDNLAGSTNQKELYIGVLQNVDVPLPPVMEQTRIADKIESLYQQLDNIANHIE